MYRSFKVCFVDETRKNLRLIGFLGWDFTAWFVMPFTDILKKIYLPVLEEALPEHGLT